MLANKTYFVCGPKFTGLFSWNAGGIAVDRISFRFWISGVVPEIFASKIESCQKSHLILDAFFALPNFTGPAFQSYTNVMASDSRHIVWKMFCEDTPTGPEVIVANTLNFKPNFKFLRLKFFGGHPSHFGCALSMLGQSLARVKISGRSTP